MNRWWLLLFAIAPVLAQSSEGGRIEFHGDRATLIVDSPRPVDSAAITLAEHFGMRLSVEDPPYLYKDDVKDVTAQVSRVPNLGHRILVPKGGRLEVDFPLRDGKPADAGELVRSIVSEANSRYPFNYRVEEQDGLFTAVPTGTRDALGRAMPIVLLLDRPVTIPRGTRSIAETANLMATALSAQTGLRVSCCQSFVAGIPWGMASIDFEAEAQPAREILKRLIAADLQGRPNRYYWLQRCDPAPSPWCFINLSWIRDEQLSAPPLAPVPSPSPLSSPDVNPFYTQVPK